MLELFNRLKFKMEKNVEQGLFKYNPQKSFTSDQIQFNRHKSENIVANYDKKIVATKLRNSGNEHNFCWSCKNTCNLKKFSQSLFGKTWPIILSYVIVYYTVQVLFQTKVLTTFCTKIMFDGHDNHTWECDRLITGWFRHWKESDRMMLSCITFLLGFYVNHIVKRWWDQISNLPTIESITLGLAGLVWYNQNPNGGMESVKLFRTTVLRYCLLSWSMLFQKYSNLGMKLKTKDDYIKKGLLTSNEYTLLSNSSQMDINWVHQWRVPLLWATNMINRGFNDTQIIPKDHKDLISLILSYQKKLEILVINANNPPPFLYNQTAHVAVWSFMILGVISGKHCHCLF